jgi:hypothetical protein
MRTLAKIVKLSDVVENNRLSTGEQGASYMKCSVQVTQGKNVGKIGNARVYTTTLEKCELADVDVMKHEFELRLEQIEGSTGISATIYAPNIGGWDLTDLDDDDDDFDAGVSVNQTLSVETVDEI